MWFTYYFYELEKFTTKPYHIWLWHEAKLKVSYKLKSISHLLRWALRKIIWNISLFFLSLVYSIFESLYPLFAILVASKHIVRSEKVLSNWKWYFKNNIIISHNCVFGFFLLFCFPLYKLLLSMWLEPYVNTDATSCGIILLTTLNYLYWIVVERKKNHVDVGRRYALICKSVMKG